MSSVPEDHPMPPQDGPIDLEPAKDVRDEQIWMSDGNIIIGALDELKNERHLFKCHRGLLSSRLPTLHDMFEADGSGGVLSAAASEKYEGLPFVRFYDDPKDVKLLLRVLYNPSNLPFKWWLRSTMEELEGLMHLTRKYEAEDLFKHCVTVFQNAWPSTLERWDTREAEMSRIFDEPQFNAESHGPSQDVSFQIKYHQPDPGAAVLLADKYGLAGSGACAFYALHTSYVPRFNSSSVAPQQLFPNQLPSTASKLPARLLLQFIHGREYLRHAGWQIVCHILIPIVRDSLSCDTYDECQECLQVLWQRNLSTFATDDVSFADDPLKTLRDLCGLVSASTSGDSGMCLQCRAEVVEALQETRRYIWDGLPIYFEIDKSGPREKSLYELSQNLSSRI